MANNLKCVSFPFCLSISLSEKNSRDIQIMFLYISRTTCVTRYFPLAFGIQTLRLVRADRKLKFIPILTLMLSLLPLSYNNNLLVKWISFENDFFSSLLFPLLGRSILLLLLSGFWIFLLAFWMLNRRHYQHTTIHKTRTIRCIKPVSYEHLSEALSIQKERREK